MTPHEFNNLGYKIPIKDPRNFILEKSQPVQPFPATYKTDISMLPVFNQEQQPDCVECAVTLVKQFHEYSRTKTFTDLCKRFLAILTVKADGFPFSEGTNVQNALNVLHKSGTCETSYLADNHSLDESTFIGPTPSPDAILNATGHTIASYAFLSDLSANGLKNAIYQNGVVVIGLKIDQNWWTAPNGTVSWAMNDVLPIRPPAPNSTSISGHAITLYAYDTEYFYFRNHWSTDWADGGHGWFSANELPEIYEAAVIVDLTPDQIKAQQVTQNDVQITAQQENKTPSTYLSLLLALLEKFVEGYQNLEASPEEMAQHVGFVETVNNLKQEILNKL